MSSHPEPIRSATARSRYSDYSQEQRLELLVARFPLVNDHPDVSGLLRDPLALGVMGASLADGFKTSGVTVVCAPEARGPILGALTALELGVGLVLVRKAQRNHPGADHHYQVGPTWRGVTEEFQARSHDLGPTDRVLAVDDWVTTGSTLSGIRGFVESAGATYIGASVLVDKTDQPTRDDLIITGLIPFESILG